MRLGNLNEATLDEILEAQTTKLLLKRNLYCNQCWLNCQRPFDILVTQTLRTLFPLTLLKRIFGDFDWQYVGFLISRIKK